MHNLIITLIAIALFAIAATWGINHVDVEGTISGNQAEVTKSDLRKITFQIAKYRILEEENPKDFDALSTSGLMTKSIDHDGNIKFLPGLTETAFNWPATNQLKYDNGQINICFGGESIDEKSKKIIDKLNTKAVKKLSSDGLSYEISNEDNTNIIVSSVCFDTEDRVLAKAPETNFYKIWVTYKHTGEF